MITIEKAQKSDLDEIMDIERAVFSVPWSESGMLFEIESPDAFFAIAKEDGKIVGFVVLHEFSEEGEIFNIAVREEYRRKRVGTALLEAALEHAENRGLSRLFLEVRAGNSAAYDMYMKNGFIPLGVRKGYYDFPKEDAIIMTREMKRGACK